MKCLNCGKETNAMLCNDCRTIEVLEQLFYDLLFYKKDSCEKVYLNEYAMSIEGKGLVRDVIPTVLENFSSDVSDFYYCRYYGVISDNRFEQCSLDYIETHDMNEQKTQLVLYYLLEHYIPNNFTKPQKWCEMISKEDNFCCELYATVAKYYGMIGEYDLSEYMISKVKNLCANFDQHSFLFYSLENMLIRISKQEEDTLRYRTKKPYWPNSEERRRAVAKFYDKKGIPYGRITLKPKKVAESDFSPIRECYEERLENYCAFWCSSVFSLADANCIYQIAAVKVRDGQVTEIFESYVKPWDSNKSAKVKSAKEIGIDVEVLDNAEDVDLVIKKFFSFVGNDVLVSTGALGIQGKLLSRAARYTGMTEIGNLMFDLLDMAADISMEFDLKNNSREYLLSYFNIEEGKTALQKANANKKLYDLLAAYKG